MVSDRKVRVPGRTSVVGGVMAGGVGLVMANGDGVAFTTPGPGAVQAPSVIARNALSAMRPGDAQFRSRSPRPSRVIVLAKTSEPILLPKSAAGTSPLPASHLASAGGPDRHR